MMSDTVWMSTALGSTNNIMPFEHSFSQTDQRKDAIDWGERNVDGQPLKAECFPEGIFGDRSASEKDYRLADLFFAGSFWVVSEAAADVLRQFDLGAGGLYPVKVLKKDRQTSVGGKWFCINFGNRKKVFLPSESVPMYDTYMYGGKKAWQPNAVINEGDIVVSRAAKDGPDLWIDPLLAFSFFISDELGKALKKAKATKGFFLHKCRVA